MRALSGTPSDDQGWFWFDPDRADAAPALFRKERALTPPAASGHDNSFVRIWRNASKAKVRAALLRRSSNMRRRSPQCVKPASLPSALPSDRTHHLLNHSGMPIKPQKLRDASSDTGPWKKSPQKLVASFVLFRIYSVVI